MKMKKLSIVLALSSLTWVSALAQSADNENIMPVAETDPAADSFDLYIRDNVEDTGLEPNTTTEIFWESPDIWYRNEADGGLIHETPYYDEDTHFTGYIYVKVTNRGTKDFIPNTKKPKFLNIFYVYYSAIPRVNMWKGIYVHPVLEDINGGCPYSHRIKDTIPAGTSKIYRCAYTIPDITESGHLQLSHYYFSYLAAITDVTGNSIFDRSESAFRTVDVLGNRGIAQKGEFETYFYDIKFHGDLQDLLEATIPLHLDSLDRTIDKEMIISDFIPMYPITPITSQTIQKPIIPEVTVTQGDKILKPANTNICDFSQISSFDKEINIKCKIPYTENLPDFYTFKVIQKDKATGIIIGGATFKVNTQEMKRKIAQRRAETAIKKKSALPYIESAYISSEPNIITVKLTKAIEEDGASIRAQSITDNRAVVNFPIRPGESQCQVDLSKLPAGATAIQLILNKNMVDNTIIVKK